MKIKDRIKDFRRVPASDIRPNPKNWRTHPESQQNALRAALAEIGMSTAVLARELEDGSLMLIDGHLRTEVLGSEIIPVLILDVNELEADKLLTTLDPIASLAGQNSELLAERFRELQAAGDELHKMVWPDYVIEPLLSADWTPPEPEPLPEKNNSEKHHAIMVTTEQRKTILDAVDMFHGENPESENWSIGETVEAICKQWIGE